MITIKNQSYTEEQIIQCLVTCDFVISKNALLEKEWSKFYICDGRCWYTRGDKYKKKCTDWMEYRKKLVFLLLDNKYSTKEIGQKKKSCKKKATQKLVKEIIDLMEKKEYKYNMILFAH